MNTAFQLSEPKSRERRKRMPTYKKSAHDDASKGVMYEVEPFKRKRDREKIKQYLGGKKDLRDYALIMLGWSIGLRCGDLVSLKIGDVVDADGNIKEKVQIQEEKTNKLRVFEINTTAKDALNLYLKQRKNPLPSDWLFPSRKGKDHITVDTVRRLIKDFCKELNIKGNYGSHSLRKTFGYCAYMQNADNERILLLLQELFGHSSPSVTKRYIGITRDEISGIYQNLIV